MAGPAGVEPVFVQAGERGGGVLEDGVVPVSFQPLSDLAARSLSLPLQALQIEVVVVPEAPRGPPRPSVSCACRRSSSPWKMVERGAGGLIVSISSISRHGIPGQSNYTATKAGVAAMTVVWAKELARHKVRAAAAAPGYITTDMTRAIRPDIVDKIVAQIPWGRMGDPGEVSHALRFNIENDYVNGRVIEVDGGLRI